MDVNSFVIGYNKGKASGGGMKGLHKVQFFNDDGTLLYSVFVSDGANALYAGEPPISTVDDMLAFEGFQPVPTNVTEDMDCFAVYSEQFRTLDQTSWAKISELSENGMAQNYFAVGDTKMVHIEGHVGEYDYNEDYGVYILGFDHNQELEGRGITFSAFKYDVRYYMPIALIDDKYGSTIFNGEKRFSMNHWGNYNYGGWAGCDLRYDILGSTDVAPSDYGAQVTTSRVGYDATESCATNPVPNTLMAALPSDLRAVMKPMTKYTDNKGNRSTSSANVTATIDYLPLLAECEIFGKASYSNTYEANKQAQYDYYASGNSKVKYRQTDQSLCTWSSRSANKSNSESFSHISISGNSGNYGANTNVGLSPIFKV